MGNRIVDDCVEKGGNCVGEVKVDVCDVLDDKSSGDSELEEDIYPTGDGELEGNAEEDTRLEGIEECSIEELSEFGCGGVDEYAGKGGGCGGEEKVDVCDVVVDKPSVDVELEEGRDAEGDGELEGRDVEEDRGRGVGRHVPVAGLPPSSRNLTSPI